MQLIIVESPTKARTFSRFLNKDEFVISSSMGHVRDLPKSKLGIDVDTNFEPHYIILMNKRKTVQELVILAKKSTGIILATDPDREGEAIAVHLNIVISEKLKKNVPIKRIVFHEITKEALMDALKNSRELDIRLFNAQQARRLLDRIVGYKISPYLWQKFSKNWLSAG
ncbi:MAG: toprim domain-containing protein, partial [Patescibacteria group bacterium]